MSSSKPMILTVILPAVAPKFTYNPHIKKESHKLSVTIYLLTKLYFQIVVLSYRLTSMVVFHIFMLHNKVLFIDVDGHDYR